MNNQVLNVRCDKEEVASLHRTAASIMGANYQEAHDYEMDASEEQDSFPAITDCSSDLVPRGTKSQSGKKTLLVPDLVSMWKFMLSKNYANKRLDLYSYLNWQLRRGQLSRIVGFHVINRVINREVCEFTGVDFWKIDRENFYADVHVRLKLQCAYGIQIWEGFLVCWCSFEEYFSFSIEGLTDHVDRADDGFQLLSPFLVPYMTNEKMDRFAEQLWSDYGMPEAVGNPDLRNAEILASKMGLGIRYLDVYEHRNMDSILFFQDSSLVVGEDRTQIQPDGSRKDFKTSNPTVVDIKAKTIVVNTNRIRCDYSSFNIYHECIHYQLHYLFFRLQEMASNDIRLVKVTEKKVEEGKELRDPIYFMEKQADRGAYALMMPARDTHQRIRRELDRAQGYQNCGGKIEIAGKALSRTLHLPHFRIKARMIQIGFIEARGALNYVERKLITPFAFNRDSWRESEVTFVLSEKTASEIQKKNDDFRAVMSSGKYVYADGHIVRNDPRFIEDKGGQRVLTSAGAERVDDCCLRFIRKYVQHNVGKYVLGRMFYDAHYVEQTNFYLSDLMNKKNMDELDAKMEYRYSFPRTFKGAFDQVMEQNNETRESVALRLHTSTDTLARHLDNPEEKISADFVIRITLMWQIPDWISKMLLDRAMIRISDYDRRHQALEYIRTILWDQGIEEANKFLAAKKVALLESYEERCPQGRKRKRKTN